MAWLRSLRNMLVRSWWGAILREHDTEPAELSGGVLKVALGVWLLLPWDTFSSSPTFRVISIMPEWLWGTSLVGIGVFHLSALRSGDVQQRQVGALIGFLVWFALGSVFVWTNPPAIGWILFMWAALMQMWASLRLSSEVARS